MRAQANDGRPNLLRRANCTRCTRKNSRNELFVTLALELCDEAHVVGCIPTATAQVWKACTLFTNYQQIFCVRQYRREHIDSFAPTNVSGFEFIPKLENRNGVGLMFRICHLTLIRGAIARSRMAPCGVNAKT